MASPCCLKCICESISSILFMGIFHPSLICSPFSVLVIPMHDAKTSRFSKTVCPSSPSSVVDFSQKFDSSKPWTWQASQDIANMWQSFIENINCGWLHCRRKLLLQKASRLWPPILYSWASFRAWWGYVKSSKLKHSKCCSRTGHHDSQMVPWSAWPLTSHSLRLLPRNVWVH